MLYASARPSAGHDPGRVGGQGHADHPAAGPAGPAPGRTRPWCGSCPPRPGPPAPTPPSGRPAARGHLGLGRIQPGAGHRGLRLGRGDQLRHLAAGLGHQVLLQVQPRRRGVPLGARRGEHRPAVTEPAHRETDTSTTSGAGPRARTSPEASASSASSSTSAAWSTPGGHGRHGPVQLPQQRRPGPGRRALLRPGHRHPDDARPGAGVQLRRSRPGPPAERTRPLLRAPADRASTSRSVVRASQASSSSPADRGPPCSRPAPCALLLGLAGGQRHLLRHRPQRPLGRLPAVPLAVLLRHPRHLGRDLRPPGAERVHHLLVHARRPQTRSHPHAAPAHNPGQ